MKLRWRIAIGFLGVFLLLALALFIFNKSSQSELEKYKAELRAQGEKLTFAELLPPYDGSYDRLQVFMEAARRLNHPTFTPGVIDWIHSKTGGVAQVISLQTNIPTLVGVSGNPSANFVAWETAVQALDAHAADLAAIRSFLQNPPSRLNVSYDDPLAPSANCFVEKRWAAQWLSGSVLLRLHSNKMEKAIEDLRLIFALAEVHSEDPTIVNQMVRVAIVGLGCPVAWELLAHETVPAEPELKSLQDAISKIDLLDAIEKGMVGERNLALRAFEFSRKESDNFSKTVFAFTQFELINGAFPSPTAPTAGDRLVGYAWRNIVADGDELFYLRFMQQHLETVRSFRAEQNFSETDLLLARNQSEVQRVLKSSRRVRYPLSALAIQSLIRAHQTCARNETFRRMTVTAIALKRHELRHGKFPPDLTTLVPDFIASVPIDCMDGKPLKYRLNPDGTFLLYSVGEDGKDDGGDPTSQNNVDQHSLWTGRDAVWPTPAR
ncbi:MAG: hypothetical protein H0X66_01765 [Verrucomicrobia bacterium]|nr:hypothetical protein [Verrucomicrobiota bacterium]